MTTCCRAHRVQNQDHASTWNRCAGDFSRQRRMIRSSAGEAGCPSSTSAGGSLLRIALIESAAVAPANARRPLHHLVQDGAQREDVGPVVDRLARAPARATCSPSSRRPPGVVAGAMVSARSRFAPGWRIRARPKSRIVTRPSALTNRLAGLMSRCTIPRSCAAASPSGDVARVARAPFARATEAALASTSASVSPSRSCITAYVHARVATDSRGWRGCWDGRAPRWPALRARTAPVPRGRSSTAAGTI